MKPQHIIQSRVVTNFDPSKIIFHSFSDRLRPRTISELILPETVKKKLLRMHQSKLIQNMLFVGVAGVGKSTCADLLVADSNLFVRRFNAALDRSVSDVTEIESFALSPTLTQENKVAILEEVDNVTKAAQKALLTIIENATVAFQQQYSTKFILVANDAHKLIEPLKSRCLPISFNPYSVNLDEAKSTLLKTIESRFDEIEAPFCRVSVQRIVDSSYPDFRMIANRIEFELL